MSARRTGARLLARTLALGLTAATLGLLSTTAPAAAGPLTDLYPWGPGDLVSQYVGNEPGRLGADGTGSKIASAYTGGQSYNWPRGAAVDTAGNTYVLRGGQTTNQPTAVFKVTRTGTETQFGTFPSGYYVPSSADLTVLPDGDLVVPMVSLASFNLTFIKFPRAGGTGQVITTAQGSTAPLGVGTDRFGTLHWAIVAQGAITIYRQAGFGGYSTVATVPTPSGTGWGGFDVDSDGNAYLLNRTGTAPIVVSIMKLPRTSTTPVVLASDTFPANQAGGSASGLAWLSTGEVAWQRIVPNGLQVYRTPDSDTASTTDVTDQGFYPGLTPSTLLNAFPALPFTDAVDASVGGTVKVGQQLTASGGTYEPASATLSYSWRVAGSQVATTSTYTPVAADAGKSLSLVVTAKLPGYQDSVSTTAGTTVQAGGIAPTLTGATSATGTRGQSFSYTSTATGDPAPEVTLLEGELPKGLELATTGAITGTPEQAGLFKVRLRATNTAGTADLVVEITIVKAFTGFAPTVTGDAVVGSTLTASPGTVTPTPDSVGYQWQYDDEGTWTDLADATGATYDLTTADLGRTLRASVTVKGDAPDASGETDPVGPVGQGTFTIDPPTISGDPVVGGTLTCAAAEGTPGTVSYAWTRGEVSLASTASYDVQVADLGSKLICTVTSSRDAGYADASNHAESSSISPGSFTVDDPTMTGTPRVGETLTCTPAAGTEGNIHFVWSYGKSDPVGEGPAYPVQAADHGNYLRCYMTVQRPGYHQAEGNAFTTRSVAQGRAGTYQVTLSETGTVRVGKAVRASVAATGSTPAVDGAKVTWQWAADGTPIAGATKASFVPGPDQADTELTATATVKRPPFQPAVTESAPVTIELKQLRLALETRAVGPGQEVDFTIENLRPGQVWALVVPATGAVLAKAAADGESATGTFTVPSGLGRAWTLRLTTSSPDRFLERRMTFAPPA